jgi:hypothetical protein
MLTRTQALEGGANVTCISKVRLTYRSIIRLTILGHYATHHSFMVCYVKVCGLEPCSSTGFVLQCVCTIFLTNYQYNSSTMRRVLQANMRLTRSELQVSWLLVFAYSFCHGRLDIIIHAQTEVVELWAYWSQSVCRGPQGQAFRVLGTFFW